MSVPGKSPVYLTATGLRLNRRSAIYVSCCPGSRKEENLENRMEWFYRR